MIQGTLYKGCVRAYEQTGPRDIVVL